MRKMDRSAVFGCNNDNNNNNNNNNSNNNNSNNNNNSKNNYKINKWSLFHKINIDIPYYKNVNLNKAI